MKVTGEFAEIAIVGADTGQQILHWFTTKIRSSHLGTMLPSLAYSMSRNNGGNNNNDASQKRKELEFCYFNLHWKSLSSLVDGNVITENVNNFKLPPESKKTNEYKMRSGVIRLELDREKGLAGWTLPTYKRGQDEEDQEEEWECQLPKNTPLYLMYSANGVGTGIEFL